jgi:DNA-directed RNA polymerase
MVFQTLLPIKLDATCNGLQHMALLSNEQTLFKKLNLVSKAKGQKTNNEPPSDFYNFLLHKLINLF